MPLDELRSRHDALVLATGAQRHRQLALPGAELDGVHLAMEYLVQQNRRVAGLPVERARAERARPQRRDPGRRRHERRLPRQRAARGLRLGRRDRARPDAAQGAEPAEDVARVAVPDAHLPGPRGGRRARVAARDGRARGRGRPRQAPARAAHGVPGLRRERRAAARARARRRGDARHRPRARRGGLHGRRERRSALRPARPGARPARPGAGRRDVRHGGRAACSPRATACAAPT